MLNLSVKYWMHHKKRAAVLLSAIMVSTMAMTAGIFLARSASQGVVRQKLNTSGEYDLVTVPLEEKQLEVLSEIDHIAAYGTILNGGVCQTQYSEAIPFGVFGDEQAQDMFHYAPEKGGRYPQAPGEICGYRGSFRKLGVAPVVGNSFALALYDTQGNFTGSREFTIVGILNEADSAYGRMRSLEGETLINGGNSFTYFSEEDTDLPEMFLHKEDLAGTYTVSALIRCKPDCAVRMPWEQSLAYELWTVYQIATWESGRLRELSNIAGVVYETENELYTRASHLSDSDFYSTVLIPGFLGIVLVVSFVSVYVVAADAMKERQKQFGLYRSMGMSVRDMRRSLLLEAFFFDAAGVAAGYAAGIIVYALYLRIVNAVSDVSVSSAFGAHVIARAVSLNPYVYPWLLGFLFSAVAMAVPMLRSTRLSPNEMLFPEKASPVAGRRKHAVGNAMCGSILYKVTGRKLSGSVSVSILIFITGWTFVFGAAFMMGKADNDNNLGYMQLDTAEGVDADYVAQKDLYHTMCGIAQFNRHNEGISAKDLSILAASGDTAEVNAVIKLPGLKILCNENDISTGQREALSPLNIANNEKQLDFLQELYEKSKAWQGYAKDDLLYRVPAAAIAADFMESLSSYVVSGEIDMAGLAEGKKIVMVEYPDAALSNPYAVGDTVSFTDVVIDDPDVEAFDFSHGTAPEGYEPTFYYDYTDKSLTNVGGYSFGKKVVFDAQICAILHIDDDTLKNTLNSESFVYNSSFTEDISPGYEILCVTDALPGWGLPDRNYTDVQVNLAPGADVERFELLWYNIIGKSGKINSVSRSDIKRSITRTEHANLILFASMICLVVVMGCFGMVNTYYYIINENRRNLQIMRAVGINKKDMAAVHIRGLFLCPFLAVVTSLLPIAVFDLVKRYARYYAFELGHNFGTLADSGKWIMSWSVRFPWFIEMWKQPLLLIMAVAFLFITLLNIASAVVPLKHMSETSIVDGIRTDDF